MCVCTSSNCGYGAQTLKECHVNHPSVCHVIGLKQCYEWRVWIWVCVCVCVIMQYDMIWYDTAWKPFNTLVYPFLLSSSHFLGSHSSFSLPSLVHSAATSACLISSLFLSSLFILSVCGPFLCIIHSLLRLETLITTLLSQPTETRLNQTHTCTHIHEHRFNNRFVLMLFSSSYHTTNEDLITRQKKPGLALTTLRWIKPHSALLSADKLGEKKRTVEQLRRATQRSFQSETAE